MGTPSKNLSVEANIAVEMSSDPKLLNHSATDDLNTRFIDHWERDLAEGGAQDELTRIYRKTKRR